MAEKKVVQRDLEQPEVIGEEPQFIGESLEEPQTETEEGPEFHPSFDPKWQVPFQGLTYIGHLQKSFRLPGHNFTVRTLNIGEKLEVALICKPWEGSIGYAKAYRSAIVAAGILLVDGTPIPVAEKGRGVVEQRFEWVVNTWYDPIVDAIFEEILALENIALDIVKELGIFSERREAVTAEE